MKLFTHVVFLMLSALPSFASAQTTPLRIIEKPRPKLPPDYGTLDVEGVVRLKVTFLASGKVGSIAVISKLTGELSERAIAAAKLIKFEPKKVDSVPMDSFKVIEYSYSWRTCGWGCPKQNSEPGAFDIPTIPLRLLAIPSPDGPKNTEAMGGFSVRVEFLANGQIGKIDLLSSGSENELTKLAVEAAKRIKFEPMKVNGVPTTVSRIIKYYFDNGRGWQTEPKPSASGQVSALSGTFTGLPYSSSET